jgi:hypothetical protein
MAKSNNPIVLSRGNTKVHKALIWNLPAAKTCPGSTALCREICYAKDAEVLHNNVVPQSRARQLEISKLPNFRELMIEKLNRARLPRMRIHESGDFYSQKYLDDWVAIIQQFPERKFWAYTKSWNLDFTEALKLPNFNLRYSVDVTTAHYPAQDIPLAAVSEEENGTFVCPATLVKGHAIRCMKDCSFCAESKESLTFRPHGNKKNRVAKAEKLTTDRSQLQEKILAASSKAELLAIAASI